MPLARIGHGDDLHDDDRKGLPDLQEHVQVIAHSEKKACR